MTNILRTIEELRTQTGLCLAHAYSEISQVPFSEQSLTQAWLSTLREQKRFYEDGWYAPPPHGIITVFGKPEDGYSKVNQPSFRPELEWPQSDRFYESDDIILIYASPIDRATNLIGDFGLNLYLGPNPEIREHFTNVLRTTLLIADYARAGLTFKELYEFAMEQGLINGFSNSIESSTDKTGTNIGHTIPLSFYGDPTHDLIVEGQNYEEIKEIIRIGRVFVNSAETQTIESNMAFTIEPRFSNSSMPNTMFHLTMVFENGEKRICHGFRPIMEKTKMDYLLELLP